MLKSIVWVAVLTCAPALAPAAAAPKPSRDKAASAAAGPTAAAPAPAKPDGSDVLDVAGGIADGGGYNAKWAGSGCPSEILFGGKRVLAKSEGGTYCSGFTFSVAMAVAERRGLLAGKTLEQVKAFQKDWYGATPKSAETQCAYAMAQLKVGGPVAAADAEPGDFAQLWRVPGPNGKASGHSVVFVGWVVEGGERVGLRYRSSQSSTDGVGTTSERFADAKVKPGRVDRARTYFGRLAAAAG